MVQNEMVSVDEIEKLVKVFNDYNGSSKCDYCNGKKSQTASDHPERGVISLSHDALTTQYVYITVQDEIAKARNNLRANHAKHAFNKTPEELSKAEMEAVKKAYTFKISEIMVNRSN